MNARETVEIWQKLLEIEMETKKIRCFISSEEEEFRQRQKAVGESLKIENTNLKEKLNFALELIDKYCQKEVMDEYKAATTIEKEENK